MNTQWLKKAWKEARWGAFNYLVPFTAVINIILLGSLRFSVNGLLFYAFAIGLFSVFLAVAWVIGHFHGAKQQATDALMENKAVIDAIRQVIKEELRAEFELENR